MQVWIKILPRNRFKCSVDVDIVDTWPGALAHYYHDFHQMPFGEGLRGEEVEVFILRNWRDVL